jgi:hypothetical protein
LPKNEEKRMYRWMKWIAPVAAMVLLTGFQAISAKAQDAPTTAPAGKATVTVTVVDADSKPVADAKVTLMPPKAKKSKKSAAAATDGATTPAKPTAIATGTTDADGKVALAGVADGTFQIQARSKTAGSGKATVTVADGQDATASITMKPKAAAAPAATQPAAQ